MAEEKKLDQVNSEPAQVVIPPSSKSIVPESKVRRANNLFMLIIAVTAGFAGGWLGSRSQGVNNLSSTETKQQIISNESELISSIAENVGKSVVSISVKEEAVATDLFGFAYPRTQEGAGTGVILNKDGLVITNRHVIPAGAASVNITLSDGTKLEDVEVLGRTNDSDPLDVAFLKINDAKDKELVPADIGDSAKVKVGEKVVAIGNALGQFQNTVTSGIISGYGRDIIAGDGSALNSNRENLQNLFQTDAAINPGNSGGPLVNISGEIIGLNVAVAEAQNIGFAIPINDIKGLIANVEKNGKLVRPYLGVRYVEVTDDVAYLYNLDVKRGAYISPNEDGSSSIIKNSPAEKAGLKEKDIVKAVNDTNIDENNSLISILGRHAVGDKVTLTVQRGSEEVKLEATLEAVPEQ